jgi:hypothetical protein
MALPIALDEIFPFYFSANSSKVLSLFSSTKTLNSSNFWSGISGLCPFRQFSFGFTSEVAFF